jgi:hypothetical protein
VFAGEDKCIYTLSTRKSKSSSSRPCSTKARAYSLRPCATDKDGGGAWGGGFVERTEMSAATVCYLCPSGDDDNLDRGVVMSLCLLHACMSVYSELDIIILPCLITNSTVNTINDVLLLILELHNSQVAPATPRAEDRMGRSTVGVCVKYTTHRHETAMRPTHFSLQPHPCRFPPI